MISERFLRYPRIVIACSAVLWVAGWSGQAFAQKDPMVQPQPAWIWSETVESDQQVILRQEFEIGTRVTNAILQATADNTCEVFLNGLKVLSSNNWSQLPSADVTPHLRRGLNVLTIVARNEGGPAGAIAMLHVMLQGQSPQRIVTDGSWKVAPHGLATATAVELDTSRWQQAKVVGQVGDAKLPWGRALKPAAFATPEERGPEDEFLPQLAEHAQAPPGFVVEKVFAVPSSMGSWVSLAKDNRGRLIASDQASNGLYLISPGDQDRPTKVEKLPVELSGAQGLLWAFDSLYAMVNGGKQSGLHRLRDTDGDGRVDTDEFCMPVQGSGEHGPHAIALSPDGQSLFVGAGNHTKLPELIAGSRIPRNWNEDHLLPRRWDANGHAAGILAPGGWVCNVDPSGKQWTVFSMGYRNQYDFAFNADGELFVYDADMEWDFGSPWYRPTRVCHATSGSEFGWRSGTGKWPVYYEDSLPPAIDIGPGSPTGVVFGYGAKFPAKYQNSLFILDWTYSTIYSIELTPDGSTYRGQKADFITGSPLPVTDAVVGDDGNFYFTAGGRGTQSSLYRVRYVGEESTAAVSGKQTAGSEQRALRRQLEAWHGQVGGDTSWMLSYLSHEDRFVRYAARIALESQPVSEWRAQAAAQTQPRAAIHAMLALARQGNVEDLETILQTLTKVDFAALPRSDQLGWLRTFEVAFARHGQPNPAWREKLLQLFDRFYPSNTYEIDAELVQLLVYLKSPSVVAKTIRLMSQLGPDPLPDWGYLIERNAGYGGTVGKMLADMPPVRAIHFAFVLRNATEGWSMDDRQKYFEFFLEAAKHPGGNSYAKFLMQFRDDAMATCSAAEKIALEPLTSQSLLAAPIVSTPPQGPGRVWTKAEALEVVQGKLEKRNYASGRNLYHATSCAKCHRIGGEGGAIGPDLSTAAKKFSLADMLDAILEPSKAISDQYGSNQLLTQDGRVLIGRTVEIGDEYYVYTADPNAKPVILKKDQVEEVTPSKLSQMPAGLVDTLNSEELKDLMAYLVAAGDPRAKLYRK
jgi:putative heme-binding domain-containing protein